MAKKNKKKNGEEITEVFDIEKPGKETKEIVKESFVEERKENKGQIKHQEKQLGIILIVIGVLVLASAIIIFSSNHVPTIKYENTNFQIIKQGSLTLYQTSIPVIYQGKKIPYNFYLRTNPNDLKKINFTGQINFLPNAVVNTTEFNCNGDQVIAIANLLSQYRIIGTKVIKDENATCDPFSRYLYVSIIPGNETKVVQTDDTCYIVYVNNCEILPATEKLMAENFVELNKKLSNSSN